MSTLLLRLAAPLQSWGVESKFDIRQTGPAPSKSAVLGLLACALGIRREDRAALEALRTLSFAVRIDQEGELLRDYHGAKSYKTKDAFIRDRAFQDSYQTNRYYLSDAVFVAAVSSGDEALIQRLDDALHSPAFPLYLGRRSCPPTLPVSLGVRPLSALEALRAEPWHASEEYQQKWRSRHTAPQLRLLMDAVPGQASARIRDVPLSYDPSCRRYTFRNTAEVYMELDIDITRHDAMAEVEACT